MSNFQIQLFLRYSNESAVSGSFYNLIYIYIYTDYSCNNENG